MLITSAIFVSCFMCGNIQNTSNYNSDLFEHNRFLTSTDKTIRIVDLQSCALNELRTSTTSTFQKLHLNKR